MRHFIAGPIPKKSDTLLLELGYKFHNLVDGVYSFKRVMHERPFPRYHVYVREMNQGIELDMHVDQEHPYHEGNHAEEWAYRGPHVQKEMMRIEHAIEMMKCQPVVLQLKPKRRFIEILLGR